jgi:cytochrome P450 family 3 subfamily A
MNLVLFLLAGYETTSTALSYMFYVLATHSEEQQRLINEVDEFFPSSGDVNFKI